MYHISLALYGKIKIKSTCYRSQAPSMAIPESNSKDAEIIGARNTMSSNPWINRDKNKNTKSNTNK